MTSPGLSRSILMPRYRPKEWVPTPEWVRACVPHPPPPTRPLFALTLSRLENPRALPIDDVPACAPQRSIFIYGARECRKFPSPVRPPTWYLKAWNLCVAFFFYPSVQVRSWKQHLPLETILTMLQVLVPQVENLCKARYEQTCVCLRPVTLG